MPTAFDRYKKMWRYRVDDARQLINSIEEAGFTDPSIIELMRSRRGLTKLEIYIYAPHKTTPPADMMAFANDVQSALALGTPLTMRHK
jgi:hypothetical protein